MDCYLVVVTRGGMPEIPERFKDSHVKLSASNACIVAGKSLTSAEIMDSFGIRSSSPELGIVVKLERYQGFERGDVIDKWDELEKQ